MRRTVRHLAGSATRECKSEARAARLALALAIGVHVLLGLWFCWPRPPLVESGADRLTVRLLDPPPENTAEPPLPEPDSPARAKRGEARPERAPSVRSATSASAELPKKAEAESAVPAIRLFRADGGIELPAEVPAPSRPLAGELARGRELLQRGHNPLRCAPTQYTQKYVPRPESVGDELARKYGSWLGLYNPHSEWRTRRREAAAVAACDEEEGRP